MTAKKHIKLQSYPEEHRIVLLFSDNSGLVTVNCLQVTTMTKLAKLATFKVVSLFGEI